MNSETLQQMSARVNELKSAAESSGDANVTETDKEGFAVCPIFKEQHQTAASTLLPISPDYRAVSQRRVP